MVSRLICNVKTNKPLISQETFWLLTVSLTSVHILKVNRILI